MIRFLFRLPEHRQFEFKPRFYDENKEDLEKRRRAIYKELNPGEEAGGEHLRHRIDRAWVANHKRKESIRSNRNILVIAFLLTLVAYYFLR